MPFDNIFGKTPVQRGNPSFLNQQVEDAFIMAKNPMQNPFNQGIQQGVSNLLSHTPANPSPPGFPQEQINLRDILSFLPGLGTAESLQMGQEATNPLMKALGYGGAALDVFPGVAAAKGAGGAIAGAFPLALGTIGKHGEKLPMDEVSRMGRARDSGFDTDEVLYRGSTSDEATLSTSIGHEHGVAGVSTSPNRNYAETHTYGSGKRTGEAPNMVPMYGKKGPMVDYFDLVDEYAAHKGVSPDVLDFTDKELTEFAQSKGYIASILQDPGPMNDWGQNAVDIRYFNPDDLRPVFDAFDTAKITGKK